MRSFRASRVGRGDAWQIEIISENGQVLECLTGFASREQAEAEAARLTRAETPSPT